MVDKVKTIEAIKIYLSKTCSQKKVPFTLKDLLFSSLLFFLVIPMFILTIPLVIIKIKREGIPKDKRKYFLYYNKKK
jgi:hypothetical protein